MKLFIDTWGWVVLKDPKEPQHSETTSLFEEFRTHPGGIITSDYVLNETFTLVFRRRPFDEAWRFAEGVVAAASGKNLVIEQVSRERFAGALRLRKRFADKPGISFTDLTTMVIMSELKIADVLTGDDHFRQVGMGFRVLPE